MEYPYPKTERQAELIGQSGLRVYTAPRVDILIHYLVRDEPKAARFQSGLFQNSGRPKLAAHRLRELWSSARA